MRKITEVLRLSQEQKLSIRAIARSCSLARSTVADYIWQARVADLVWPLPEGMDDERVAKLLFPVKEVGGNLERPPPDMAYIHNALKRKRNRIQQINHLFSCCIRGGVSYCLFAGGIRRCLPE